MSKRDDLFAELIAAAEAAEEMLRYLENPNFPLPDDFPVEQIKDICIAIRRLPNGSAEGCRVPLEISRSRLSAIRSEHVSLTAASTDDEMVLTRGMGVDRPLGDVIAAASTALDAYRRYDPNKPEEETLHEQGVSSEGVPGVREAMEESLGLSDHLRETRKSADNALPDNRPSDALKRGIADVQTSNDLARAELRGKVVVRWLRRAAGELANGPANLRRLAMAVESTTKTIRPGWEEFEGWCRDVSSATFDRIERAARKYQDLADEFEGKSGGSPKTTPQTEEADRFDYGRIVEDLINGIAPAKAHIPMITALTINDRRLSDLQPFRELKNLNYAQLSGTKVADLVPLAGLTGLQSLDLGYTQVADLVPLAGLTGLQSLYLGGTQVADLGPLAGLTGLQSLDLLRTQVADLVPLAGLTGLQSLDLGYTQVADLVPLAGLTGLQNLYLRGAQVADLGPLAGLTGLQSLDLGYTQVADLGPLAGLTGLQSLDLGDTQVADLGPLAGLTGLQSLDLGYTQVADLGPLASLTGLQNLYLRGTQVSESELNALKHALPNCQIGHESAPGS